MILQQTTEKVYRIKKFTYKYQKQIIGGLKILYDFSELCANCFLLYACQNQKIDKNLSTTIKYNEQNYQIENNYVQPVITILWTFDILKLIITQKQKDSRQFIIFIVLGATIIDILLLNEIQFLNALYLYINKIVFQEKQKQFSNIEINKEDIQIQKFKTPSSKINNNNNNNNYNSTIDLNTYQSRITFIYICRVLRIYSITKSLYKQIGIFKDMLYNPQKYITKSQESEVSNTNTINNSKPSELLDIYEKSKEKRGKDQKPQIIQKKDNVNRNKNKNKLQQQKQQQQSQQKKILEEEENQNISQQSKKSENIQNQQNANKQQNDKKQNIQKHEKQPEIIEHNDLFQQIQEKELKIKNKQIKKNFNQSINKNQQQQQQQKNDLIQTNKQDNQLNRKQKDTQQKKQLKPQSQQIQIPKQEQNDNIHNSRINNIILKKNKIDQNQNQNQLRQQQNNNNNTQELRKQKPLQKSQKLLKKNIKIEENKKQQYPTIKTTKVENIPQINILPQNQPQDLKSKNLINSNKSSGKKYSENSIFTNLSTSTCSEEQQPCNSQQNGTQKNKKPLKINNNIDFPNDIQQYSYNECSVLFSSIEDTHDFNFQRCKSQSQFSQLGSEFRFNSCSYSQESSIDNNNHLQEQQFSIDHEFSDQQQEKNQISQKEYQETQDLILNQNFEFQLEIEDLEFNITMDNINNFDSIIDQACIEKGIDYFIINISKLVYLKQIIANDEIASYKYVLQGMLDNYIDIHRQLSTQVVQYQSN